jgi:hypothetical protein
MTNQDRERYTFKNISTALCIILFFLYGTEKFRSAKEKDEALSTIMTLQDQKENFELQVDELGRTTATQAVMLIDAKKDYESLLSDFTQLKNTKSETKVYTETRVDSVYVPTTIVDTMFVDLDTLPVYRFVKDDEYFFISARVGATETLIEKVSFKNDITFSHRWERKNFLSKKTYFVEVNNTNPYLNVTGLQNYTIEEDKRFYERGRFWFVVGLGGGFLLAQ